MCYTSYSRKKEKYMVEKKKKKGIRKDVANETNEDFAAGMKQIWVGTKGILLRGTIVSRTKYCFVVKIGEHIVFFLWIVGPI